ncbi:STAS domain-containing protein [Pontibacter sp. G13]|uniref:STAS domain-containing protein n=1 Tax=Pontibacter sp. G13 TaxID=3074898 RepID=UPI00288934AD|nr:STAS domain-containing protein [Pontibacter sp. G13]WNJ21181.1 STAS domain-containing protein [Pontibacter sp. G13]
MRFEQNVEDRFTVFKLMEEKLDSRISPAVKHEFTQLNFRGNRNLILDLSDVKYVDSSGLSAILTANRLCTSTNGILVVCGINDHVRKLMEISRLNDVLNLVSTEEEAREAVFMSEIEKEIVDDAGGEPELN